MLAVKSCPSNVYASLSIFALVEKFCSCDAAWKLLDSEENRLFIHTATDDPRTPEANTDLHPNEILNTIKWEVYDKSDLTGLVNTIFSHKSSVSSSNLQIQAKLGDMGMDAFAIADEEIEWKRFSDGFDLTNQCSGNWNLKTNTGKKTYPEVRAFYKEVECDTDEVRERWMNRFQKNYCSRHPEDSRSCNAKKEDLCHNQLLLMPWRERTKWIEARACKLLLNAPANVKNSFFGRDIAKKCPGVPDASNPLARVAANVGFAAYVVLGVLGVIMGICLSDVPPF